MKKLFTLLMATGLMLPVVNAQDKTKSADFDGDDDKIVVPHTSALNLGRSAFTIEAYITASGNMVTNAVVSPVVLSKKGANSSSNDGFLFGLKDDGKIAIQLEGNSIYPGFGGGGGGGVSASDLRDGVCHHIAWTREVGGVEDTVMGYQDAAYVKKTRKAAGKADISNMEDLWIGASEFNTQPNIYQFEGQIKEIRIWNYAKTEAQIFADRNKHLTGNESGLLFYWRLNENSGTTAYDCGPNGADGTLDGAGWATFGCDNMDAIPSPNNCMPSGPVGIEEAANLSFEWYPNPSSGEIRLKSNDPSMVDRVMIYDMAGKLLLNKNWNANLPLDVSGLNEGIYMIQLWKESDLVHKSLFTRN